MIRSLEHNLGYGFVPEDILQLDLVKQAFNDAFDKKEENMKYRYMNYGNPKGDKPVREAISKFYMKTTGCFYNPDNMIVNFGCTIGLTTALMACCKPGDNILIEAPSFFSAVLQIVDQGFKTFPISRKNDGQIDLEELEKKVIEHDIKGFYLVTNYSNPIGKNLNKENRVKLYQLAKKLKFYVFSDDIYETLYIDEDTRTTPLFFCDDKVAQGDNSRLTTFDNNSNEYIISMNSFNKIIGPQIKVGFNLCHKNVVEKHCNLAIILAGGFSFNQHLVRSYIELGILDKLINQQIDFIRNQRNILYEVISKCKYIKVEKSEGGYYLFASIDEAVNMEKVHSLRQEYNLNYIKGEDCGTVDLKNDPSFSHLKRCIRLSYSYLRPKELKTAGEVFVKLIEDCAN